MALRATRPVGARIPGTALTAPAEGCNHGNYLAVQWTVGNETLLIFVRALKSPYLGNKFSHFRGRFGY